MHGIPTEEFDEVTRLALIYVRRWSARRRIDPSIDAADLEQEARIGVWQAAQRFEAERGRKFSSYAVPYGFGRARRLARDASHIQRRRYEALARGEREFTDADRPPLSLSPIDPAEQGSALSYVEALPDPHAWDAEDARLMLETGMAELGEPYETLIRWHFWEELSQRDIAARLGCSQMHVSRLIRRGLWYLRGLLEGRPVPLAPEEALVRALGRRGLNPMRPVPYGVLEEIGAEIGLSRSGVQYHLGKLRARLRGEGDGP